MSPDPVSAASPAIIVRRYLDEVLSGGRPSALDDLVAAADLRHRATSLRRAFPDLAVTVRRVIEEGEMVGVHVTGRGTHLGVFQGVPPTGRTWTAGCTALYRVVDGRIADAWITWDLLAILEQLGGITRAPSASA